MKQCSDCGRTEEETKFYNKRTKCADCEKIIRGRWLIANADKRAIITRRNKLKAKYGLTPEQYDYMLASQGGRCWICRLGAEGMSAASVPRYLFLGEGASLISTGKGETKAMYRLACRECGEAFDDEETPVPSRSIAGGPLVHEECA